jgi:hypothetical protein
MAFGLVGLYTALIPIWLVANIAPLGDAVVLTGVDHLGNVLPFLHCRLRLRCMWSPGDES